MEESLSEELQRAVDANGRINRCKVEVYANGHAEIVIHGVVGSYYQKQIAQEVVRRACQRKEIQFSLRNDIRVVYPRVHDCPESPGSEDRT